MIFSLDNLVLTAGQAACIALPAAGLPPWAERFRGPAWALVLPLSIVVVIGAIELEPSIAKGLTWVALILVPVGCALALGWAVQGARPWMAALAGPLLAIAWIVPHDRFGQAATIVLIAGSAVTAGRLLAAVAPLALLKLGVVAMAIVDAILVFSGSLEAPNQVLVSAVPATGLPQLQSASFGAWGMGYGDFFAAAVVGGILAAEARSLVRGAVAMVLLSLCWDQLFLVYDVLPATIPPALVLIGYELWPSPRGRLEATADIDTGRTAGAEPRKAFP